MLMTEIKRDGWEEVETQSEALLSMASRAKELFGYDVLEKALGKKPVAEMTCLGRALKTLEIEPMNKQSVLAYQKERMVERTTEKMQEWLKKLAEADQLQWWLSFSGVSWRITPLESYKQPIPEFVIAKAIQIKEAVPDCLIYIEALEEHPDPFLIVGLNKGDYDQDKPKEFYYVEVWSEPKFESQL